MSSLVIVVVVETGECLEGAWREQGGSRRSREGAKREQGE